MKAEYRTIDPCAMLSPVPAVMVSCRGREENARPNIITVAWAGTVCSSPPMVSISLKPERHSYQLIKDSGEFAVNLVGRDLCRELDRCGVKSGREADKFAACGFEPVPVEGLAFAPGISGCPAVIGCRVKDILPLGSHHLFLAEAVSVRVREDLFDQAGNIHLERAQLVCYSHGLYQAAQTPLGFFGWSVARPEAYRRRMAQFEQPVEAPCQDTDPGT